MSTNCNADLDHPCDADDGKPCESCAGNIAYWRQEWERYGRGEKRYTHEEIMDAYSDPTERAKRDSLLREIT